MKIVASSILLLLFFNLTYGQKEVVDERLKLYDIPEDFITNALKDGYADYYFQFRQVTWVPSDQGMEEIIQEGEYNPASPAGEKWQLLKINGEKPDNREIKKFSKFNNTFEPDINPEIDELSYSIAEENDDDLVILLTFKRGTLPKRYEFLGKCSGLAYIDKHTHRLTQIEYRNEGPVKIWGHRAIGLSLVQYFTFREEEGKYVIDREELDLEVENLAMGKSILYDIQYTDYKEVK